MGSDSGAEPIFKPLLPLWDLFTSYLQMSIITDVYLSLPPNQGTCLAGSSSCLEANHGRILSPVIPTVHWKSLENVGGICSQEVSSAIRWMRGQKEKGLNPVHP